MFICNICGPALSYPAIDFGCLVFGKLLGSGAGILLLIIILTFFCCLLFQVWQDIARTLGSHSAKQCENKFKYLRAKYFQKKDNMSHKSSGARHIHFDYFSEMDEIYCKEPIVKPVAIASSSREYPLETFTDSNSNRQTETADSNPETETTNSNPQRDTNDDETTESNNNPGGLGSTVIL